MPDPTGVSVIAVEKSVAEMRAFGEIMGVPTGQLDAILGRLKVDLEVRRPPGPPGPPTP